MPSAPSPRAAALPTGGADRAPARSAPRAAALPTGGADRAHSRAGSSTRWIIALCAVVYLYCFPYFPKIQSANELPRAYLVKAMVDHGTFEIDDGVRRWGTTADVSPSNGHQYSNKAPGSSFLAAPAYAVASWLGGEPSLQATVWICRVVTGVIPTLLFLVLLARFLARLAPDPRDRGLRDLVLVGYALGSMAMTYSILFISHQLAAVCVASAWILALDVAEGRGGWRRMLAAGFLVGAAPLVDYQAAFAAVPAVIHVVVVLLRRDRRAAPLLLFAVLGAALPVAALLGYHTSCFGGPLRTGYAASTTFAMYHQQGFLGITKLRAEAFWGSMTSADNGLLIFSPWVILAAPGLVAMWRRGARAIAITTGSVIVIYVLFISSINFWRGGWQVGPRYITAMLPFLLPAVLAALQGMRDARGPWLLGVGAGLILAGVAVHVLAAATFPHFPERFPNPLYEVVFRILGEGRTAWNLGWLVGQTGVLGLVPYLLAAAAAWAWPLRGTPIALAVGAVVATGIVLAYGAFHRGGPADDQAFHDHVVGSLPTP